MEAIKESVSAEDVVLRLVEDFEGERSTRVNVFEECVKGGQVVVHTEDQASEIARMILRAEGDLERTKAIAAAMVQKAESRLKGLETLFMVPLSIWTSAQVAGKKTRSLILEGGKLALRKVPASVKTVDPDALLKFCQESLPHAIEMVPKVNAAVVKAWEEKDNEIAPGRVRTPESESFKVSVPTPKE